MVAFDIFRFLAALASEANGGGASLLRKRGAQMAAVDRRHSPDRRERRHPGRRAGELLLAQCPPRYIFSWAFCRFAGVLDSPAVPEPEEWHVAKAKAITTNQTA